MEKYYSTRGDKGKTDQLGESRISKAHLRIQTVGALDEASAAIGVAKAEANQIQTIQLLSAIQKDLYRIMTLAALEKPAPEKFPDLDAGQIDWLEKQIDSYGEKVEQPTEFILPGKNRLSAAFGLARTIVRRAERQAVALNDQGLLFSRTALPYLNRLSSLCFVLELMAAQTNPRNQD